LKEQKKIPRVVITVLVLMGYIVGMSLTGILLIVGLVIGQIYDVLMIWALLLVASLILLQILQWRKYEVLVEWDILKPKKKKPLGVV